MNDYVQKYKHKFKIILVLIIFSFLVQNINANYSYEENIYSSGILNDGDGIPTRMGVVVLNDNDNQDFRLEFSYKFNDETLENKCVHEVVFEDDLRYQKKIYCGIPTRENNGYYEVTISVISQENETLHQIREEFFYNSKNSFGLMSFLEYELGTQITIDLSKENITQNTTIYHDIPSTVLESINSQNKNSLISSEKEFQVIEENPIISWSVSSGEEEIQYTLLNRTVENVEKQEFKTYPAQDRSVSTVIIFSIIVLLIIIFLPLFRRKQLRKS